MSCEQPTLERIDPNWLKPGNLFKIWSGKTDIHRVSPFGVYFVWNEHLKRYKFASTMACGKILDISCGTGYGLKFLKERAEYVIGADLSQDALSRSIKQTKGDINISLVQLNAKDSLPFDSEIFDTVTSFETIEHLDNPLELLKEIKRVIKKSGKFIVSTPNVKVFSKNTEKPTNNFHKKEFDLDELSSYLKLFFNSVDLYSQGNISEYEIDYPSSFVARRNRILGMLNGSQTKVKKLSAGNPRYFVAVCTRS